MPFPLDHYIEASHVDYKERLEEKKPRSWLKSVSAFANTEGGHAGSLSYRRRWLRSVQ